MDTDGHQVGEAVVMRNVSFVEHIELEFKGNVIPQTMLLADVDNDLVNELIVGNIYGEVGIFKGDSSQPWKKISLSGMLTCLSVGGIKYPKKNNLVCMTAEGRCYVYDVSSLSASQSTMSHDDGCERPVLTQDLPANARVMCLADIDMDGHIEMVIGYSDRVVRAFRWHEAQDSHCGHFVLIQKWQLAGQIGNIAVNYSPQSPIDLIVSQPGATFVSLKIKPFFRHVKSDGQICTKLSNLRQSQPTLERSGSFVGDVRNPSRRDSASNNPNFTIKLDSSAHSINMCGIRDSPGYVTNIDNVSTHSELSYRSLENINLKGGGGKEDTGIVSHSSKANRGKLQKSISDADQPSTANSSRKGSAARIECSSEEDLVFKNINSDHFSALGKGNTGSCEKLGNQHGKDVDSWNKQFCCSRAFNDLDVSFDSEDISIVYHPSASYTARDDNCSTFIIGSIQQKTLRDSQDTSNNGQTYNALATLDGSVVLLSRDHQVIWHLQVDHDVFAISKLDVTGDGREELICCAWNGQTYIVNHNKEIVGFHFTDSVVAFIAGNYSINERSNTPCFVYATSSGRIYIYHHVMLSHLQSTNLFEAMASKPHTHQLLTKLNIKEQDQQSLKRLYRWCLYGKNNAS